MSPTPTNPFWDENLSPSEFLDRLLGDEAANDSAADFPEPFESLGPDVSANYLTRKVADTAVRQSEQTLDELTPSPLADDEAFLDALLTLYFTLSDVPDVQLDYLESDAEYAEGYSIDELMARVEHGYGCITAWYPDVSAIPVILRHPATLDFARWLVENELADTAAQERILAESGE